MEALIIGLLSHVQFDVDQFLKPVWLWLILVWPLFWFLHLLKGGQDDLTQQHHQRTFVFKHPLIHLPTQSQPPISKSKNKFSVMLLFMQGLRGLIIIGLAIALAQPIKLEVSQPKPQQKTVRDVVFVIESSASFLLPDYQVAGQPMQRFEVVKSVLDEFIAGLSGNRFGLVIYAQNAYTLMPLTADQTAARLNLKRLKPYLAGRTDEAMGEALGLALKQNETALNETAVQGDRQINSPFSDTLKRVVVLISDGSTQPSRLKITDAINYAQTMNVPIYTVGVGASSASADKRQFSGLLYQPLESTSLKQIARDTLGQYYQIGSGDDLQKVLTKIDQSEGVPLIAPPNRPLERALYFSPLTFSVLVFALYGLLSLFMPAVQGRKEVNNE